MLANGIATSQECTYVTVAASQTTAQLSTKKGTYLSHIIIVPETTSPGNVILYDAKGTGAVTVYTFPGGASSVGDLTSCCVQFHVRAKASGATADGWHITTGANVNVIAVVQTH